MLHFLLLQYTYMVMRNPWTSGYLEQVIDFSIIRDKIMLRQKKKKCNQDKSQNREDS